MQVFSLFVDMFSKFTYQFYLGPNVRRSSKRYNYWRKTIPERITNDYKGNFENIIYNQVYLLIISAPELYNLEPITLAADIWSFGVLAYALLSACLPFDGDTDTETIRNIQSQELDFPDALFEDVSEEAKDFIKLCLNRDVS